METNVFKEKSFCEAADYTRDQKKYIFEKTKLLKNAWKTGDKEILDQFRINDKEFGIYEVFLEDSTRTRESFRNASEFHRIKLSMFNSESSSFNKSESYSDGFMTLVGYSNRVFIVRSKLEGVCRWLEKKGKEYAERNQLGFIPAFINAGDGIHEHPTQELLDEFTFIEDNNWSTDNIHLALVGDLFHGRTTHSKADGLQLFDHVKVDLIAPPELEMPRQYVNKMKQNGFTVREFQSLDEYLNQSDIANRFYFTRPQLERMGEDILKRQNELRAKISFKQEFIDKLIPDTFFYHPLPRHKAYPGIPAFLDNTPLNRWEKQSINGMFIRIVLLAAISGKLGDDFRGKTNISESYSDDFILEENPSGTKSAITHDGINPLPNGIVIDRFYRGSSKENIWQYLFKAMKIMRFDRYKGFLGIGESKKDMEVYKGLIFLPEITELSDVEIKRLATIAKCTVNFVINNRVVRKLRLSSPPRIYDVEGTGCKNDNCISHSSHMENVPPEFIRKENKTLECLYCGTPHQFQEIWK